MLCPIEKHCGARSATSATESRRQRKRGSSCARRSAMFVRVSMARVRRSRPSQSGSRKRAARGSSCSRPQRRRHRRAPAERRRGTTNVAMANLRCAARARGAVRPRAVLSSASRAHRHGDGLWPSTPMSLRAAAAAHSARPRPSGPPEPRDRRSDPPRHGKRRGHDPRIGAPDRALSAHHEINAPAATRQETARRSGEHSIRRTPRYRPGSR